MVKNRKIESRVQLDAHCQKWITIRTRNGEYMFEIHIGSDYMKHGNIRFVAIRQTQNERSKSYKWQVLIVAHTKIAASVISRERWRANHLRNGGNERSVKLALAFWVLCVRIFLSASRSTHIIKRNNKMKHTALCRKKDKKKISFSMLILRKRSIFGAFVQNKILRTLANARVMISDDSTWASSANNASTHWAENHTKFIFNYY